MKKYLDVTVLVFDCGGRQAPSVCKGFYQLGCRVVAYCKSRFDTGYLTRFVSKKILYKEVGASGETFYQYGIRVIKEGKYDLVVPLGDNGALFLSQHKSELSQYAKIAVNDWEIFQNIIDKTKTMRICQENNISAPRTVFSDDPIAAIYEMGLQYPVVVKPKTAAGSIGFNIIHSELALIKLLDNYDNSNGPLFVQEYIEQDGAPQYGADLFRDRDGIIRAALVAKCARWFPIDGGSGLLSITIHDDEIVESCKKLLEALDWNGYANIDLVWDAKEKRAKILEINGRTGASIKLNYLAGVDMSKLILENELGYPVSDQLEYTTGKMVSCFLVDILWFLKAKNRFSAKPSWFARWHIKDVVFSWDDPLPSVGFFITSIRSFGTSMRKRKRLKE